MCAALKIALICTSSLSAAVYHRAASSRLENGSRETEKEEQVFNTESAPEEATKAAESAKQSCNRCQMVRLSNNN